MVQRPVFNKLTCDQVFQVWETEPESIRILDLRSPSEFARAHVPGARNLRVDDLEREIADLAGRLGLIIAPPDMVPQLDKTYGSLRDVAFLKDCHRWNELVERMKGAGNAD